MATPLAYQGGSGPAYDWVDGWIALLDTVAAFWQTWDVPGSINTAVDWMQDVCRLSARVGPAYECFAVTLTTLGGLYVAHGNLDDAQPMLEQAYAGYWVAQVPCVVAVVSRGVRVCFVMLQAGASRAAAGAAPGRGPVLARV